MLHLYILREWLIVRVKALLSDRHCIVIEPIKTHVEIERLVDSLKKVIRIVFEYKDWIETSTSIAKCKILQLVGHLHL